MPPTCGTPSGPKSAVEIDDLHERINVPGATISGLIRLSPVSFSGPRLLKVAMSSALSACGPIGMLSGTFTFGVAALKSLSWRLGLILIVAGKGLTLSEAPTVRQFLAVPGALTVEAPGPELPAAIMINRSGLALTNVSTSSEKAVYLPRLLFEPQLLLCNRAP